MFLKALLLASLATGSATVASAERGSVPQSAAAGEPEYVDSEYLEKVGPPKGFLSIQHFYSILKRCEKLSPEPNKVASRLEAYERLLSEAKTSNGVWRTFVDVSGDVREKRFPSAREMFASPEFSMDVRRYDDWVALVPVPLQLDDCAKFEELVAMAFPSAPKK